MFERMGRFILTPHSFPIIIIFSRHMETAVGYMISRKVHLFANLVTGLVDVLHPLNCKHW